ncbi:uncharacterized protein L969DRAFT_95439 [Mixia osmundae IAM 14324]|uniref:DNA polymerase alpha subunit B n=1 Tax=Mixia osmundae (strain CBS 9802 / IAM 14324 / JCM 22182 / KY 12970) TaxID=764103 RepID=G7E0I2_MIXOS|nr:uncharacterized protein L969DRAFT_95439 [Mixia osmundae IAM 14324]KEI38352.1 hypothetical protein L969DRAFT_95439 [Mixia osmundae IAM 14324]GAA96342.1 hypothetical protein E5Q_03008 [Mixia osmundae IAM 14324]
MVEGPLNGLAAVNGAETASSSSQQPGHGNVQGQMAQGSSNGVGTSASNSPDGAQPPLINTQAQAKFQNMISRIQYLRSQGAQEGEHPELTRLIEVLRSMGIARAASRQNQADAAAAQAQAQASRMNAAPASNGMATEEAPKSNGLAASAPAGLTAPASPPLVQFTPAQYASLKCQIYAFKCISKGVQIPAALQEAVNSPTKALDFVQSSAFPANVPGSTQTPSTSKPVETAQASGAPAPPAAEAKASPKSEKSPEEEAIIARLAEIAAEDAQDELDMAAEYASEIYPYNSFVLPLVSLRDGTQQEARSAPPRLPTHPRLRTLPAMLVPTLMPEGLDPQTLFEERERYIQTMIQMRMRELQELPLALPDGASALGGLDAMPSARLKAIIELKALQLLNKQKALREDVVLGANRATALSLVNDRTALRRHKRYTIRDARATESLERKQKLDREQRAKKKHLDQLDVVIKHGQALDYAHRVQAVNAQKIGKAVLRLHSEAEKEDQKRVERVSKERLKALRNDDEEAYLKLIDTAKDTRITHLIKQTDTYLDSLAQAVVAQQNDAIHSDSLNAAMIRPEDAAVDQGGQPETVNEAAFGAAPVFTEEETATETTKKVDYYNVAHKIKETVSEQPHILIGGQLKDYQIKGLQWMISLYNNRLNGILADEMGLGKTIQTISLITYLIERKKQNGPFLIIVPLSTVPNWVLEFDRWAPSVSVVTYKGSPNARKEQANKIRSNDFQVLLTTFEYIIKDRPLLSKIKWVHMIIDEGHRMKNANSKLSTTLSGFYSSRYRLILTGTPLQNNLPELWALLNFVLPKIFNSVKSFDEWFNAPFANTGGGDRIDLNEEESMLVIRRLHKVLRPFLLRRLKKDVESELPDKVERLVRCKMSALQSKLYKQLREHGGLLSELKDSAGKPKGMKGLKNTIMQLRKLCNHPFAFEAVETAMLNHVRMTNYRVTQVEIDNLLWRTSGKFELLDRILPKLFRTGHRVLMFFQMTVIMDIMQDFLRLRGIDNLRLDGSTNQDERAGLLAAFNKPDSQYKIFLLSTRAGGLGLNLQSADTVILYDSDWNPHQDLQAQDRAHRIGQKKEVRILRLVTEKSVEEQVLATARRKVDIDKKVIQGGKFDNKSTAEEREAFFEAILAEADADDDDEGDLGDEELNEILARGSDEMVVFAQMDVERKRKELNDWRASGHKGPAPERLITETELPDIYKIEVDAAELNKDDDDPVGRGHRQRTEVHYNDGLTDDQFLDAIDDDETDLQEAIEKKRARKEKRATNKARREAQLDDSNVNTPTADSGLDSDTDSRKRKRASATASVEPTTRDEEDAKSKKRRKTGAGATSGAPVNALKDRVKAIINSVVASLEDTTTDNEAIEFDLLGPFVDPVDVKMYPDYAMIIQRPMCVKRIRQQANSGRYKSFQALHEDFVLIFQNARMFNDDASPIYIAADILENAFTSAWEKALKETEPASRSPSVAPIASTKSMHKRSAVSTPMADSSDKEDEPPVRPMQKIKLRLGGGAGGGKSAHKVKRKVVSSDEEPSDSDDSSYCPPLELKSASRRGLPRALRGSLHSSWLMHSAVKQESSALRRKSGANEISSLFDNVATPLGKKTRLNAGSAKSSLSTPLPSHRHTPHGSSSPVHGDMLKTPFAGSRFANGASPMTPAASPYATRKDVGEIVESLNSHLTAIDQRATASTSKLELASHADPKSYDYRYMYEKLLARSEVLDNQIDQCATLLCHEYSISLEDVGNPCVPCMDDIVCVGRVCLESDTAKLNDASIWFESSRLLSSGSRVPLKFEQDLKVRGGVPGENAVGFYPGLLLGLRGRNTGGGHFSVKEILLMPPVLSPMTAPAKLMEYQHGEQSMAGLPMSIIVANGPYTLDGDLEYTPLEDLSQSIMKLKPHLVILLGPFIDGNHPLIRQGAMLEPPKQIFRNKVATRIQAMLDAVPALTILLVPSLRDLLNAHVAFPQSPYAREAELGLSKRAKLLPNPTVFSVNEVTFGITSVDSLFHLRSSEHVQAATPVRDEAQAMDAEPVANAKDALSRACRHILRQRTFYPLFPAPVLKGRPGEADEILNLDVTHQDLLQIGNDGVDVLILPSRLKAFAKIVDGVVTINPASLTKGHSGGTFARLTIHPSRRGEFMRGQGEDIDGLKPFDAEEVMDHRIYERCRVDLVRV